MNGLKLKAISADEVEILSAALEGAITSPGELSYSSKSRQFTMTASRFMWEQFDRSASKTGHRTRSGLLITDILSARRQNLPQNPDTALELLSLEATAGEDGAAELTLHFAGSTSIALSVECVDIALTDVGDAWETDVIPAHELDKENS
ncbi:MAG: DUF2948 family protein [Sneathiella sp.]|nr:DUF2948 family protein [Sneathiella sp.]